MGQRINLVGANFVRSILKRTYDDAGLNDGSLCLLDTTHSLSRLATPPVNGQLIPNVAIGTASRLIGAGDATSLAFAFSSTMPTTELKMELTGKGAIHSMLTQSAAPASSNFYAVLSAADLIKAYIIANPTHQFAAFAWNRFTRGSTTGSSNLRYSMVGNRTSPPVNYLLFDGASATNGYVTGMHRSSILAPSAGLWTGAMPTTVANTVIEIAIGGTVGAYSSITLNQWASYITYRWHLVDLTAAGLTYAQADAADLALYTSLFADGGRLAGDTFTSDTTKFP
jgi:hypothetical protein